MGLETASYVSDLVITNPTSNDPKNEGDDHIRLIKTAVKASLPKDLRSVSSPVLGQSLFYNGIAFENRESFITHLSKTGSVANVVTAGATITSNILLTDGALGDVWAMHANSDAYITVPADNPQFEVSFNAAITVPDANEYFLVQFQLYNNTTGAIQRYQEIIMAPTGVGTIYLSGLITPNSKLETQAAAEQLYLRFVTSSINSSAATLTLASFNVFFKRP